MNILAAQAVFIAVFGKAFAGIDHKNTTLCITGFASGAEGSLLRVLFVDDDNTGRNAGAVKQVGR